MSGPDMQIDIVEAAEADKQVLRNLMQCYVHDLSETVNLDVDPHGRERVRSDGAREQARMRCR